MVLVSEEKLSVVQASWENTYKYNYGVTCIKSLSEIAVLKLQGFSTYGIKTEHFVGDRTNQQWYVENKHTNKQTYMYLIENIFRYDNPGLHDGI